MDPEFLLPARRTGAAVLALAIASTAASLLAHPAWLFAKYPNLASGLVAGVLSPEQAADASPLYLLLHLLVEPGIARVGQALAAGVSVVAVFAVARAAAGPSAGLVAAGLLAFAQPWLLHAAVLEPDLFIGALHACAAALLLAGRPGPRRVVAAGALLGLSAALRPTGLAVGLAAAAWLAARGVPRLRPASRSHARDERPSGSRVRAPLALAGALALAAAAPPAALHLLVRQPVTATMSWGPVFFMGHRPEGTGFGGRYPTLLKLVEAEALGRPDHPPDAAHGLFRRFAAADTGAGPLSPVQADRYWLEKGLAFAREEPAAFLRGLGRTLLASVAARGDDSDVPEVRAAAAGRARGVPGRWIVLLGLGGLAVALAARRRIGLLVAWVVAAELAFAATYFQTRYALAVLPAWCALAAVGLATVAAGLRRAVRAEGGRARPLAGALALALFGAAPLALARLPGVRQEDRLAERLAALPVRSAVPELRRAGRFLEAQAALADEQAAFPDHVWPTSPRGWALGVDEPAEAARAAERARARFGAGDPVDAYLLAVLEVAAGRYEAALPLADRAAAAGFAASLDDAALDPDLLAADCLVALGRREEARARVERSLARRPGTLDGLARAAAAGSETHRAQLLRLHDGASARWALARARARWGDLEGCVEDAGWLVAHLPEAAPFAQFERARCLAGLGRGGEALQAYARTFELAAYLHGTAALTPLVRAFVASAPADLAVARYALVHLSRVGDLGAVRALVGRHPALGRGRAVPSLPGLVGGDAPERRG
ncbi:MAG: hypothetical protein QM704_25820 [Anaeromyxobacteraceae bacterium]